MAMISIPPLRDQTPDMSSSTSGDEAHLLSGHSLSTRDREVQDTDSSLDDYEDDSDPSLWIDIGPTTTTTIMNNRSSGRSERCLQSPSSTIKLQVPSLLCDCLSFCWEWIFAVVEAWWNVLSASPFPSGTLQKVSIALLVAHRISDNFDPTMIAFVHPDGTLMDLTSASSVGTLPHFFVWGIPGLIGLISVSFVLTLELSWGRQQEAVIATALILLIFLEALLPLFILGCTSMFLFQQVSWETGLLLLVVVWLGSTCCAHCIRRILYRSLGHG